MQLASGPDTWIGKLSIPDRQNGMQNGDGVQRALRDIADRPACPVWPPLQTPSAPKSSAVLQLHPHPQGCVLPVKAQPGAKRNAISGIHGGMLKVSVTQAPEKGKANRAVAEVLCQQLDLRPAQLELIAGHSAAQKRFLVRGLDSRQLQQRIATALAKAGGK